MERSQRDVRGKWKRKRKRRRRCKGKGTSSLEVKENRGDGAQLDGEPLRRFHPSAFSAAPPKRGPRAPKRRRPHRSHPTCERAEALVQLSGLRPGPRCEAPAETGPPLAPEVPVGVEVSGVRFEGRGPAKKRTKRRAAELALRSFIPLPGAAAPWPGPPDPQEELFSSAYGRRRVVRLALDVSPAAPRHLGPAALLGELRPGVRYTCLTERLHGRPDRSFVVVVRVEGRAFEGCGHSKRAAKARAAGAALRSVYGVGPEPETKVTVTLLLLQFFAESIFHLVEEKYSELTHGRSSTSSCKGLAAVVMTRGLDLRSSRVVSLATGTKCRDPDGVGDREVALSDCHGEVLSRTALVRFLYAQLETLLREPADCQEESIFVPNEGGGFRLRDGVLFHMYASSSPCGDARLHCPHEAAREASGTNPEHQTRFHCHLRVKVDGGEGTLPITARGANRNRAGPLAIMSCTDKIAKWSVVGLQGALLSRLVEPVYLHSLTVGTLSHTGHLGRAVARRLAPVRRLPFPYRRRKLLLGCLSRSAARPAGKAPNVSVNWSRGDGGLEEICGATGRRKAEGTPSRLCRGSMAARWQALQLQVQNRRHRPRKDQTHRGKRPKMAAGRYQRAKQQFTGALQGAGLGTWPTKPPEPGHSK
ncbi:double-stranded RNA-specific editase B2-like [Pungitius pungitius]|uniref:double-stranded RNA-specific editase B2-like n=1 Tax=Pungitius pungitius TaxID=134920 RepID=UPI002E13A284